MMMDNMNTEEEAMDDEYTTCEECDTDFAEYEQDVEYKKPSSLLGKIFSFIGKAIWWIVISLLLASWWIIKTFFKISWLILKNCRGLSGLNKQ